VAIQTYISAQTHHPTGKINKDEMKRRKKQNEVRKAQKKVSDKSR